MNINFNKKGWAERTIRNYIKNLPRLVAPKPTAGITKEQIEKHAKKIMEGNA